jgi:hypothetical protein
MFLKRRHHKAAFLYVNPASSQIVSQSSVLITKQSCNDACEWQARRSVMSTRGTECQPALSEGTDAGEQPYFDVRAVEGRRAHRFTHTARRIADGRRARRRHRPLIFYQVQEGHMATSKPTQPDKGRRAVIFKAAFEETPEQSIDMMAHVFNTQGELIGSVPVKEGQASFDLDSGQLKGARIFFAPAMPEGRDVQPTLEAMERLKAYEPVWRFDPGQLQYEVLPIPADRFKWWPWCRCRVRGRVIKVNTVGGVTYEQPVCDARVHICEVDPIRIILPKLPDRDIFRLRDDLLELITRPIPIPQPDPPPFTIDPGFIDPVPDIALAANVFGKFDPSQVAVNPQPLPPRERLGMASALNASRIGEAVALNPQPLPPKESLLMSLPLDTRSALLSNSVQSVREALIRQIDLVKPWLCWLDWLHLWFYRCDELAVLLTDGQGRFDTTIWYSCFGDKPDLYFWVEYSIGGAWTTVYNPGIRCNTYWNYACGSEVTLRIADSRVPGCGEPPVVVGKKVVVRSIGESVGVREIHGVAAGANEGLVKEGNIHNGKPSPFGGTLEPRVDFGNGLAAAGITHYRWSVRPLGGSEADWRPLTEPVQRYYRETVPAGNPPIYKWLTIGPDPAVSGYFVALNPALPANFEQFVPSGNNHYDLATGYFDSTIDTDPVTSGVQPYLGKYEMKLELFKNVGGTPQLVDLTAEGIELYEATADFPLTPPETDAPALAVNDRIYHAPTHPAGHISGYRLVVHIDNRPCFGTIEDVVVNGAGAGPCGFLEYNAPSNTATLRFRASHPAGFAALNFDVVRVSTFVPIASAPNSNGIAVADLPLVDVAGVNGFTRSSDTFSKGVLVSDLLADVPPGAPPAHPCTRAAFAETLHVYALATDGYTRLYGLDAPVTSAGQIAIKAFAITPQGS